ncbi:hypothetical protein PHO31112_02329 [Pandoraea horticolens]|uniref:ATPase AAA-type core domain-containing protein n=2 Tax=Pandoraea horticolens TaxID=2508298 RepID=A0A5E4V0G1_9BURK|nr:hypothetical protein PHO31112_02329 [Pandoraea horticolens]
MFGLSGSAEFPIPEFSALVVPNHDGWIDSGFRTRVRILVRLTDERFEFSGHLGFVESSRGQLSDVRRLENILDDSSSLTLAASDSQHFFTMLPSLDSYRKIVILIGVEQAGRLLVALRDVVALSELQPTSNIPDAAADTAVFQKSFVRTAEAFFAYKNAGSILHGLDREKFHRMSKDICVNFQLAGCRNRHELKFEFDHAANLPKRIAVVIGKNGVGKSQALSTIVRAALNGSVSALNDGGKNRRVLMNRLLAFAPTNESASVFPGERRKNAKVWYKRFSLNRGGRPRRRDGVADTVIQIARSPEYIGDSPRWRLFLNAIEVISNWREIALLRRDAQEAPVYIHLLRSGLNQDALLDAFWSIDLRADPVRFTEGRAYPLSSGEISFLKFAAHASLHIENGSLLLLDEPETHLHPNFISSFVAILDGLLALTGSAAVIATHSAYFVREVFSEQVTVLRTNGGIVSTAPLRLQTFGADVGAISYFVFEEDEPSKLVTEVEQRLLKRFNSWSELYEVYGDELSPKLLGSLRLALESGQR